MSNQKGRGGMGSRKHGKSGRSGPPAAVKRETAEFFDKEAARRKKRKRRMYSSVHEALRKDRST